MEFTSWVKIVFDGVLVAELSHSILRENFFIRWWFHRNSYTNCMNVSFFVHKKVHLYPKLLWNAMKLCSNYHEYLKW